MAEVKGGAGKGFGGWKGEGKGVWAWGPPPGLGGKGGGMWYKGAINPRVDGWGYQGVCWTCGKIGHKTGECTLRLQEVEGAKEPTKVAEGFVDEDAVEVEDEWTLSCVEKGCSGCREEGQAG